MQSFNPCRAVDIGDVGWRHFPNSFFAIQTVDNPEGAVLEFRQNMIDKYVEKGYGAKRAVEISLTLFTMQCGDDVYATQVRRCDSVDGGF